MKKIIFYVPDISTRDKDVLSSHIQLPTYLFDNLSKSNNMFLVTSRPKKNRFISNLIDKKKLILIEDGINRNIKKLNSSPKNSYNLYSIIKFFFYIKKFLQTNDITHFHSFGSSKVLLFNFILKTLSSNKIKFIHTIDTDLGLLNNFPYNIALNSINKTVTSTEYAYYKINLPKEKKILIKHGIKKLHLNKVITKKRILFWRDPTYDNGADLAEKIFINLSQKFNHLSFTIAVRSHEENIIDLKKIQNSRIEYIEYPYPKNQKIEDIIRESLCVILPFRKLSTNPQLAVLETMRLGSCLITTPIESNLDIIENEKNGYLIDINDHDEWASRLSFIIQNVDIAVKIGNNASETLKNKYNWNKTFDSYNNLYN